MPFTTSPGNNPGAGAIQNTTLNPGGQFIPEIWESQLIQDLEENLVLAGTPFTNRLYEGTFTRGGDVVRIPHFKQNLVTEGPAVSPYGSIGDADHAELEYMQMTVGKGSSFNIEIDSAHQWQTQQGIDLMSGLVSERARVSALAIDELVAYTVLAGLQGKDLNGAPLRTTAVNTLPNLALGPISTVQDTVTDSTANELLGKWGTDVAATDTLSIYDYVLKMQEILDTRSAPADRWLFVSPRMRTLLLKDPNFIDAARHGGGGSAIATGSIGTISGLQVVVANTLGNHIRPSSPVIKKGNQTFTSVDLFMGSTSAVSVVIPFAQMAAYNPEAKFTSAVKSRLFYDAQITRPEQLLVATNVQAELTAHNSAVAAE